MRFSFPRRAGLALALTVLAFVCAAGPGASAGSYPSPQTLSDAGQDAGNFQIAIDGSERATIVWQRVFPDARIQSVRLDANGAAGPVQTLSPAGQGAFDPRIAIDSSDRATIVWGRGDGYNYRIQSTRLAADGTPGAVQTLSAAGGDPRGPRVAVDSAGRATVVWWRFDGFNDRIQSVRLAADGTPGTVRTLSEAGDDATNPEIAIDGADRVTVVWDRSVGPNERIESVRLAADGTPGPVRALSEVGERVASRQLAIDGSERATVVWSRSDGSDARIESVRLAADGTPGPAQTLSAAGLNAVTPQIAVDDSDRATIVWWRGRRIQSVRLGPDGVPEDVQTLSAAGQWAAFPYVAVDRSERATITWQRSDGANNRIQAVRLAPEGTPGPVQTVSEAGGEAQGPVVAVDSFDRATIVWRRFDGSNYRIQSVRGENSVDGSASARKSQRQKGRSVIVKVKVKGGEDLKAMATAVLRVGKSRYQLKPKTKRVSAGTSEPLKLKPRFRDEKRIVKALKKGKRGRARVGIRLVDEFGNSKTETLAVRLKR